MIATPPSHRPVRVLHVVWNMNMGGLEMVVMNLIRDSDPARLKFDVYTQARQRPYFADELERLGARWLPGEPLSKPVAFVRDLARVLREEGPYDVVHCHLHRSAAPVLLLAALMRVPVRIAQSHNDVRSLDARRGAFGRLAASAARAAIWASCTHAMAVSANAAKSLFGSRGGPKLVIQPCGVDLTAFDQPTPDRDLRTRLGIPRDAVVIGSVARFAPVKNHLHIVDMAPAVLEREPRAHFLLVGDGPERASIQRLILARGLASAFTLTGTRADVADLMISAMDCFLFPTHYEGLGIVVVEAQAAGLPCIVSDAVPDEATILPELVMKLSLDQGIEAWAQAVVAAPHRRQPPGGASYLQCEQSHCGLAAFRSRFHKTYLRTG